MSDSDSPAIRPGSTPLNSGPEHTDNLVRRFDDDQPEDYVDPVTVVNHAKPEGEHVDREPAADVDDSESADVVEPGKHEATPTEAD